VKPPSAPFGIAHECPDTPADVFENLISNLLKTPKLVKTMGPRTPYTIQATVNASPTFSCSPERRGLIVCQGGLRIDYSAVIPHFETNSTAGDHGNAQATRRTPPLWLLQQLPNMIAAHLAREWEIRGSVHSFSQQQLPLEQGNLTAQILLDSGEADEILFIALDASPKCRAAAWHFTKYSAPLTTLIFEELFPS